MRGVRRSMAWLTGDRGTRDWVGSDMVLRDRIFSTITEVFKRHGATALDTPVRSKPGGYDGGRADSDRSLN